MPRLGERSFILTGDDAFLTPFLEAKAKLPDKLADLRVLVGDNSDQAEAVASALLIGKRIEVADQTIELRGNNGFEAALR